MSGRYCYRPHNSSRSDRYMPYISHPRWDGGWAEKKGGNDLYNYAFTSKGSGGFKVVVRHYGPKPMLHLMKGTMFLALRPSEFCDMIEVADEVKKHIVKCQKKLRTVYSDAEIYDDDEEKYTEMPQSNMSKLLAQKKKKPPARAPTKSDSESSSDESAK